MCLAGEKKWKIVMASPDDAGKTTTLYRSRVDTAVTTIPTTSFNVERVRHRSLELTVGDIGGPDDDIAYSRPDSKLRIVTVPEGIEEVQSIRNCGVLVGVCGSERRDPRGQRGME